MDKFRGEYKAKVVSVHWTGANAKKGGDLKEELHPHCYQKFPSVSRPNINPQH